jgi:hypothetical protein
MLSADCASRSILVVESPAVRDLIGTVLTKEHYEVILEDIPGAQGVLSQPDTQVGLLITHEPWRFEPFLPSMRVLYVSGAPDGEYLQKHRANGLRFLQKPFRFEGLLASVRELLSAVPDPIRHP